MLTYADLFLLLLQLPEAYAVVAVEWRKGSECSVN
jgi:hypothetical protein